MLPPIQKGLLALLVAAIVLPVCGIPLVEQNLLPLRLMLMHGALFAGSLAIYTGISSTLLIVIINTFFVIIITWLGDKKQIDFGRISSFFMISSLGGAAILTHLGSASSQSILSILWGSPYLLTLPEIIFFFFWSILVLTLFYIFRSRLKLFLFDSLLAKSLGINTKVMNYLINIFIGITVAVSMKLLGALLVDVLLILPVVLAGFWKKGQNFYYKLSIVLGLILVVTGSFGSLKYDLPVSGVMAVAGSGFFLILLIFKEKK